jgi:hypothetical protein
VPILVDKLGSCAAPAPVDDRPRAVVNLNSSNHGVDCTDMNHLRGGDSTVRDARTLGVRCVQAPGVALPNLSEQVRFPNVVSESYNVSIKYLWNNGSLL